MNGITMMRKEREEKGRIKKERKKSYEMEEEEREVVTRCEVARES